MGVSYTSTSGCWILLKIGTVFLETCGRVPATSCAAVILDCITIARKMTRSSPRVGFVGLPVLGRERQEVWFKARQYMLRQVVSFRSSTQAITLDLVPASLLPQTPWSLVRRHLTEWWSWSSRRSHCGWL